jgi:predicted RNA-binding protein with PUA-like domain
MREAPELASMQVLRRGNRLSITPVTDAEWQAVLARLEIPCRT